MDEKLRSQAALFRYSIIAPLITMADCSPADRGKFYREAAQKTYINPDGNPVKISADTISRYYKKYMEGGFDALKPQSRSDYGVNRKISEDVASQISFLHSEYPRLPATLIYAKLLDNNTITKDELSLSTVTRYLSRLKQSEHTAQKQMLRYEKAHINEVWYGDSSVGPYLRNGKQKTRTWIIALIDDASRMIVGIDIFTNDNYVNLLSVIRSAVIHHGKPLCMKFDNGASYRSNQMELLGARMGTAIHYAPPRTPTGKAKIERWFRTMKDQWMSSLNMNDFHSLDELRDSLLDYVMKYNQTGHSSLNNVTPQNRFYSESSLIYRMDQDRIDKTFLLEEEKRVSADNVIVIDKVSYEVDYRYSGQKILIRYSPDLKKIYTVDRNTGEMEEIHLLNKIRNSDGHRQTYRYSGQENE